MRVIMLVAVVATTAAASPPSRWELAREKADVHRFSTLFTARQVTEDLATDALIDEAIDCFRQVLAIHPQDASVRCRHSTRAT